MYQLVLYPSVAVLRPLPSEAHVSSTRILGEFLICFRDSYHVTSHDLQDQ